MSRIIPPLNRICKIVIFSTISIALFFVLLFFLIGRIIDDHNSKVLSKYQYEETELSTIYSALGLWRTTFDGGSQLLAIKINSLEIKPYIQSNTKVYDCINYRYFQDSEKNARKILTINYTGIWYFGIPIKTETVICKY